MYPRRWIYPPCIPLAVRKRSLPSASTTTTATTRNQGRNNQHHDRQLSSFQSSFQSQSSSSPQSQSQQLNHNMGIFRLLNDTQRTILSNQQHLTAQVVREGKKLACHISCDFPR